MARRRHNRRIPDRFATRAGQAAPEFRHLWRGLRFVVVPNPHAYEVVNNLFPDAGTQLTARGEATGRAFKVENDGGNIPLSTSQVPTSVNFTMFGFVVRRDSSSSIQSLGGWGNGWTVQQNYGAGQIGVTIWGAQDLAVGGIGTVPNDGTASTIAVSSRDLGGGISQGLFMLNGRFHSQAHFSPGVTGSTLYIGRNAFSGAPLLDTSVHCLYFWERALSESELVLLHQDPFAPIRARSIVIPEGSSLTGTARVTQVVGELLAQPDPALRFTQVIAEYLVPVIPTPARVTQAVAEYLISQAASTTRARLSQAITEVLTLGSPSLRATQLVAEALVAAQGTLRFTQVIGEFLTASDPALRVSQSLAEVLVQTGALTPTYTGQLFPRGSPPPY